MRLLGLLLPLLSWFILGTTGDDEDIFEITISPDYVQVGDEVSISCTKISKDILLEFFWYRFDADGNHDVFAVNRIMRPDNYLTTRDPGSFTISDDYDFDSERFSTTYYLTITAAQIEDNAVFGCGRVSERAAKHQLTVASTSEDMHLYSSSTILSKDSIADKEPLEHDSLRELSVNDQGYFLCSAEGFIPEPTLTIDFDGNELEGFRVERSESLVSSVNNPDYHYTVHNAYISSERPLQMKESSTRKALTCTASVEGADAVSTNVRPVLKVPPTLSCNDTKTPVGGQNVELVCIVDADPDCNTIHWTWTSGGKDRKLEAGELLDSKYMSRSKVLEDGTVRVSLEFSRVFANMFGNYSIRAENDIGSSNDTVTLIRDVDAEPKDDDTDSGCTRCITSVYFLLLPIICLYL